MHITSMIVARNNDSKHVHIPYSYRHEKYYVQTTGRLLRTVVLRANNGIISVTSLIMGMATSSVYLHTLLLR